MFLVTVTPEMLYVIVAVVTPVNVNVIVPTGTVLTKAGLNTGAPKYGPLERKTLPENVVPPTLVSCAVTHSGEPSMR